MRERRKEVLHEGRPEALPPAMALWLTLLRLGLKYYMVPFSITNCHPGTPQHHWLAWPTPSTASSSCSSRSNQWSFHLVT